MLAFAHVSDLHFSDVLANTAPGTVRHQDPHDFEICKRLPGALRDAKVHLGLGADDELPVVCSGDLTLVGGREEFAIAHLFLRGHGRIGRRPIHFGLGVAADQLGIVPGNHDQWRGRGGRLNYARGVPAYTHKLAPRHFRVTPWTKVWQAKNGSVSLELFGIDSNSGHAASPGFNYFQRGTISKDHFDALEKALKTPARPNAARAIVCHHSPSYKSWVPAVNRMARDSTERLRELAGQYGVHAILTGHTHDFCWQDVGVLGASPKVPAFYELRCASTTAAQHKLNGFLVHQIKPSPAGGWQWITWQYLWNAGIFSRVSPRAFQFNGP